MHAHVATPHPPYGPPKPGGGVGDPYERQWSGSPTALPGPSHTVLTHTVRMFSITTRGRSLHCLVLAAGWQSVVVVICITVHMFIFLNDSVFFLKKNNKNQKKKQTTPASSIFTRHRWQNFPPERLETLSAVQLRVLPSAALFAYFPSARVTQLVGGDLARKWSLRNVRARFVFFRECLFSFSFFSPSLECISHVVFITGSHFGPSFLFPTPAIMTKLS